MLRYLLVCPDHGHDSAGASTIALRAGVGNRQVRMAVQWQPANH
jgi:hypothetical protein